MRACAQRTEPVKHGWCVSAAGPPAIRIRGGFRPWGRPALAGASPPWARTCLRIDRPSARAHVHIPSRCVRGDGRPGDQKGVASSMTAATIPTSTTELHRREAGQASSVPCSGSFARLSRRGRDDPWLQVSARRPQGDEVLLIEYRHSFGKGGFPSTVSAPGGVVWDYKFGLAVPGGRRRGCDLARCAHGRLGLLLVVCVSLIWA